MTRMGALGSTVVGPADVDAPIPPPQAATVAISAQPAKPRAKVRLDARDFRIVGRSREAGGARRTPDDCNMNWRVYSRDSVLAFAVVAIFSAS